MSLAEQQSAFMASIFDDEAEPPKGWAKSQFAGLEVYRNAYRVSLVDALHETYPRTSEYAGDEAFRAAASHHLIANPPTSWTLDHAGEGFANTVAELFLDNPEVAAIASLEWHMHLAFVASDTAPLGADGFAIATACFGENDWSNMQVQFVPSLRTFSTDWKLVDWWTTGSPLEQHSDNAACVVWRENEKPVFQMFDGLSAQCLGRMRDGETYGNLCEFLLEQFAQDIAIAKAGKLLADWLSAGWLASVATAN